MLELKAAGQSPETLRLRSAHLRGFAHDHRMIAPDSLTRQHLITWMAGHDWGGQTRRSYRATFRGFFRWAAKTGRVHADPAADLPRIKEPRRKARPTPDEAVDEALQSPDGRSRLAVLILALTGIRRAECARLHTDDLFRTVDGWSLRVLGKGNKERIVPIDDDLAATIRLVPPGYLFPGRVDGHISPNWLGKLVSRALPGRWTPHTLRHRYATRTHELSHDIRAVQELLGHGSVVTTQDYTLVDDQAMRAAAAGARRGLMISGAHMRRGLPSAGGAPAPAAISHATLLEIHKAAGEWARQIHPDDDEARQEAAARYVLLAVESVLGGGTPVPPPPDPVDADPRRRCRSCPQVKGCGGVRPATPDGTPSPVVK